MEQFFFRLVESVKGLLGVRTIRESIGHHHPICIIQDGHQILIISILTQKAVIQALTTNVFMGWQFVWFIPQPQPICCPR